MALICSEINAGRIENRFGKGLKIGGHREQLTADTTGGRIRFARLHKPAEEVAREARIGIECQDPGGLSQSNSLVLAGREAHVLTVIDDTNALFELPQKDRRVVFRSVVDHDYFEWRVILLKHILEAVANERGAVVRDDSDRDHRPVPTQRNLET